MRAGRHTASSSPSPTTGVGIPTEDLPNIFERFYRVDKSRSRYTGGIGLGLTIARRLAEAHGGGISVISQEGQGTEFRVVFPPGGAHPIAQRPDSQ